MLALEVLVSFTKSLLYIQKQGSKWRDITIGWRVSSEDEKLVRFELCLTSQV